MVGTSGNAEERVGAIHRERRELAVLNLRQGGPDRHEEEVDPSRDHLGHRLRTALERNMHGLHAGAEPEAFRAQMRCSPDTGRGEIERARLRLGCSDEFADCLEALGRRNDQDERRDAERDDCRKISRRMVAQVRMKRRRYRVRGRVDEEGVAIGVRLGDDAGTDRLPCAGTVLHDDALPELRRELLEHDAGDDVDHAARCDRYDRPQRFRRPGLCLGLRMLQRPRPRADSSIRVSAS